jgi:alginate O-acetyltransferase complex protein AlgJ
VVTIKTGPDTRPEATRGRAPARAPRRRLPLQPVAFVLALGFFFGPLGAFVLGERPEAFENRALTEFPSLSDGWDYFPNFTSWAVDHLPLRDKAVSANAAFSENVFGEAPSYGSGTDGGPVAGVPSGDGTASDAGDEVEYPRVIEGENGWLYFGGDVSNLCRPARTVAETMDRLNRLAAAVESSGRRFVLTVAPDKGTIYPDNLPASYLGQDCTDERRAEFWDALRESPPAGYVDLRAPLEAEQERSGPIYRPTDTHWSAHGGAVYARELAGALDPALLEQTEVVETGTAARVGDLGKMIGRATEDEFPSVEMRRPGVTPVGRESLELPEMSLTTPATSTNETSDAPLFGPRTLLLGDSFSNASRTFLGTLFRDISVLHNEVASTAPQVPADAMADADVVVYEIVERTIASGRGALIDDAALDAAEKTLAANPR